MASANVLSVIIKAAIGAVAPGPLVETIISGVIGNRVDALVAETCSKFVQSLKKTDLPLNDRLERAVVSAYCKAQLEFVNICLKELESEPQWRGKLTNKESEHSKVVLVNKKNSLQARIKNIQNFEKSIFEIESSFDSFDIDLIISPGSEQLNTLISQVQTSLVQKAILDCPVQVFQEKLEDVRGGLIERLCAYFSQELETNQAISSLLQVRLLTNINQKIGDIFYQLPDKFLDIELELQELISSIQLSKESLSEGLKQVNSMGQITYQLTNIEKAVDKVGRQTESGFDRMDKRFDKIEQVFWNQYENSTKFDFETDEKYQNKTIKKSKKIPKIIHFPEVIRAFTSRDNELAEIEKRLIFDEDKSYQYRIAIIAGLGGIGKSTLSHYFAKKYESYFDAGCIELDARKNISELTAEIISELEIEALNSESFNINNIAKELESRNILVLIENVDSINLIHINSFIKYLLNNGKMCTLIVTTRDRDIHLDLGLKNEYVVNLTCFNEKSSINYLRATISDKSKVKDSDLRELAQLVDGLPLALNIISRLLIKQSAESLISELKKQKGRTARLEVPNRPDLSVRASIQLSLDSIGEPDKESITNFFACLSVCALKSFSIETAKASVGVENKGTVRKWLQTLQGLSLLELTDDTGDRFHFHPLVHSFSLDKANELLVYQDSKKKHATFFIEKLLLATKENNLGNIFTDIDDLNLALSWLYESFFELKEVSKLEKNRTTYKVLLSRYFPTFCYYLGVELVKSNILENIEYLIEGINYIFEKYPNPGFAVKLLDKFSLFSTRIGAWELYTNCVTRSAKFLLFSGDTKSAKQKLIDLKSVFPRIPARRNRYIAEAKFRIRLGRIFQSENDLPNAFKNLQRSLDLSRKLRDKYLQRNALDCIGEIQWLNNMNDEAIKSFQAEIEISQEIESVDFNSIRSYIYLDVLMKRRGNYDEAQEYFDQALLIVNTQEEYKYRLLKFLNVTFHKLLHVGKLDDSAILLSRGDELSENSLFRSWVAVGYFQLGAKRLRENKPCSETNIEYSIKFLGKAVELKEFIQDKSNLLGTLRGLRKEIRKSHFDKKKKNDYLIKSIQLFFDTAKSCNDLDNIATAYNFLGKYYRELGDVDNALVAYTKQYDIGVNNNLVNQIKIGSTGISSIYNSNKLAFFSTTKRVLIAKKSKDKIILIFRIFNFINKIGNERYHEKLELVIFAFNLYFYCFYYSLFLVKFLNQPKLLIDLSKLDSSFAHKLLHLGFEFSESEFELSLFCFIIIVPISHKLPYKINIIRVLNTLYRKFTACNKNHEIEHTLECIVVLSKLSNDTKNLVNGYNLAGNYYFNQDNFDKAIEFYLLQNYYASKSNNLKNQVSWSYNSLAKLIKRNSTNFCESYTSLVKKSQVEWKNFALSIAQKLTGKLYHTGKLREELVLLQFLVRVFLELETKLDVRKIISDLMSLGYKFKKDGDLDYSFQCFKTVSELYFYIEDKRRLIDTLHMLRKKFYENDQNHMVKATIECIIVTSNNCKDFNSLLITYGLSGKYFYNIGELENAIESYFNQILVGRKRRFEKGKYDVAFNRLIEMISKNPTSFCNYFKDYYSKINHKKRENVILIIQDLINQLYGSEKFSEELVMLNLLSELVLQFNSKLNSRFLINKFFGLAKIFKKNGQIDNVLSCYSVVTDLSVYLKDKQRFIDTLYKLKEALDAKKDIRRITILNECIVRMT